MTVSGNNVLPPSDRESFAVIDTGTTLVAGPSNAISQLYAHIPDSRPLTGDFQGFYSVPCTSNIEISMSFGGKFWAVSRDDFVLRMQGGTSEVECVGAFFAILEDNNTLNWVVGDAFLKNVYSVFRLQPPSVGFAALSPLTLTKGSPAPSLTTGPPSGSPLPNGASRGRGTVWVSGLLVVLARYYLC